MSLATMALPVFERAPDTAQLLLPSVASSSRGRRAHQGSERRVRLPRRRARLPRRAAWPGCSEVRSPLRISNTSGPGTGGTGCGTPTIGLSQSLARPARNSNIGGGRRAASVPSVRSYSHWLPCSVTDIAMSVSIESSGVHGSGVRRSARYSNGAAPQRGEPGVHAGGVGIEFGAVVGGRSASARAATRGSGARAARGRRSRPRARPAPRVHRPAGAAADPSGRNAPARAGSPSRAPDPHASRRDRRNAERVARDRDRRAQPGQRHARRRRTGRLRPTMNRAPMATTTRRRPRARPSTSGSAGTGA